MTTLRITREGGQIRGLSVLGHAGYAISGEDIVCAAISVLTTTCINALESVAGVLPRVVQDKAGALMALTLPEEMTQQASHDAQVILKTALQGFRDIAESYPKHFTIIDGRTSS